jgi:RNA polymerase sigma factor (sigma-70 family)
MMERVEKAVSALLDDEVRRHREIPNDRVERSIEERALSGEESLALHERLGEEGVAITFDKEEDETVADDTFPESEEARADRTVSRDLLRACLADIAGRPLLTLEEEAQLARKIAEARRVEQALSGGELAKTPEVVRTIEAGLAAKRSLVLAHMRLVLSIARRYRYRSNLDLLDLMQEGAAALMRAAEKFDPDRGVRFSTYAVWWVREGITRAIADGGSFVRIPIGIANQIRRLRGVERDLREANGGREPTAAELAQSLEWDIQKTAMVGGLVRSTVSSLESQLPGAEGLTLGETLESEIPTPEHFYAQMELAMLLDKAVEGLPPREKTIITHRFGLAKASEEETLEQIGQELGVSRERVRQLQERAMDKLRARLEEIGLREFL